MAPGDEKHRHWVKGSAEGSSVGNVEEPTTGPTSRECSTHPKHRTTLGPFQSTRTYPMSLPALLTTVPHLPIHGENRNQPGADEGRWKERAGKIKNQAHTSPTSFPVPATGGILPEAHLSQKRLGGLTLNPAQNDHCLCPDIAVSELAVVDFMCQ